ncbi:MAG: hypothetical protein SFW36_17980 [Leptolyngbyaceae cyanobacterium bins.59]|nr:hypothetical protein [Leptolyngbyaceae cyanobacterium bins.59]
MSHSEQILTILQQAQAHLQHDWLLTTAQVAQGFDVTDAAIRNHKNRKPDELLENKHWFKDSDDRLWWTKRGVVRLGFFVDSPAAKAFRDAAEDYVVASPVSLSDTGCVAPLSEGHLDVLLDQTASNLALEFYLQLPQAILEQVRRIAEAPTIEEAARIQASFSRLYPRIRPVILAAIDRLESAKAERLRASPSLETMTAVVAGGDNRDD